MDIYIKFIGKQKSYQNIQDHEFNITGCSFRITLTSQRFLIVGQVKVLNPFG